MEFEWLNKAMVDKYKELGTKVYDSAGAVHWMNLFIKQESTLLDVPADPKN